MIVFVCLLSLLFAPAIAVSAGPVPPLDLNNLPAELQSVGRGWLKTSWPSHSQEAELAIVAYELDDEVIPAFLHRFYLLMAEEYEYEMAYLRSIDENTPPDEALQKSLDFVAKMPIGPDRMCREVEMLLAEGDYALQRISFAELRARRDGTNWLKEDTQMLAAGLRRQMKRHRLLRADVTPAGGRPLPSWAHARLQLDLARKLEEQELAEAALAEATRRKARRDPNGSTRRRPTAGLTRNTLTTTLSLEGRGGNGDATGGSMDAGGGGADALVAPHEDVTYQSWRAALRSCLDRPDLSDADRRSARSLFDAWWSRARAFRQLHKADYEQIASLTSRRAHRERLVALDGSLEGLFAEFRLRLAAIGTKSARKTTASPR
jgi:hypothetical protein